jgi:hypothetical protein
MAGLGIDPSEVASVYRQVLDPRSCLDVQRLARHKRRLEAALRGWVADERTQQFDPDAAKVDVALAELLAFDRRPEEAVRFLRQRLERRAWPNPHQEQDHRRLLSLALARLLTPGRQKEAEALYRRVHEEGEARANGMTGTYDKRTYHEAVVELDARTFVDLYRSTNRPALALPLLARAEEQLVARDSEGLWGESIRRLRREAGVVRAEVALKEGRAADAERELRACCRLRAAALGDIEPAAELLVRLVRDGGSVDEARRLARIHAWQLREKGEECEPHYSSSEHAPAATFDAGDAENLLAVANRLAERRRAGVLLHELGLEGDAEAVLRNTAARQIAVLGEAHAEVTETLRALDALAVSAPRAEGSNQARQH